MIKAIAIDDEPPALRIIEYFCWTNERIDLVKTFTSPGEAEAFLAKNSVDLIFIDIQMQEYNGVEFYTNLPKKPMVIFTTAFSEYAVEGFNLNAVDYLLKPYTQERFNQAVQKVAQFVKVHIKENRTITLRTSYSTKSIEVDNIRLIESLDDYVIFNFVSGAPLEIRMTLKKLLEVLPSNEFIRVHRSFIVSVKHITSVRSKNILIGDRKIPISPNYEKEFFDFYQSEK